MKNLVSSIENDYFTDTTGDPFADIGGLAIKHLQKQEHLKNKSILELVEYIAKIYVNNWDGKLHTFFLNSKITQVAFKGQRKIDEAVKYYSDLLNDKEEFQIGYCRLSGRKTKLYPAGRDNHILSGSGTFINFNHGFQNGIYLSKEILIRMFFVPFGSIGLGDKIALLYSNQSDVTELFVVENCKRNFSKIGSGNSEGVLKSKFNNPANAIFKYADEYISKASSKASKKDRITLNLYHFTNFGASPHINLYTLPSFVFDFYRTCQHDYKLEWNKFINSHYKNSKHKGAIYNEATSNFEYSKKKEREIITKENFESWGNIILEKLLRGQSILNNILYWSKKYPFNFRITKLYQHYIRNMEQKTLEKIEELAHFIVEMNENKISKAINKLNGFKKGYELRKYMLNLIVDNYKNKTEKPLISLTEYVEYLFPDGSYWRDINTLLLIAIYQKLHENQIWLDSIDNGLPGLNEDADTEENLTDD